MVHQLGKFFTAGVSAAGTEYIAFLGMYYGLHWPLYVANGVSFGLGLLVSFTLNRQWAFGQPGRNGYQRGVSHQFAWYFVLAIVNLGIMLGAVELARRAGINPAVAKFAMMAVIPVWNFVLYKKVIFKNAPQAIIKN
jgi:putative flippase GtrA